MTASLATDIVSVADAKEHLRIDHVFDDNLLEGYIAAAVSWVEQHLGRKLVEVERTEHHCFEDKVELWFPNVSAIESISYFDGSAWVLIPDTEYTLLETRHPEVIFPNDYEVDTTVEFNLRVTYTVCEPTIPEAITQGIKLLLGTLYEQREDSIVGAESMKVPVNVEYLLSPYRYRRFV